jgi:predicted membrane channel-forming protein YqfA (hemolysin III family)
MGETPVDGVIVLLWFLALAAVGAISQRQHRSQWLWVLATVVLGPIAIVLLLALPSKAPAIATLPTERLAPVTPS